MTHWILRRLLQAIPVLWAVATVTFFMIRLAPGDPFSDERNMPLEARQAIVEHYGLDQPLWRQYLRFIGHLAVLDMGYSLSHPGFSVAEIIRGHFPATLQYALPGFALALIFGTLFGVWAALREGRPQDHFASTIALAGICLPNFVLAPLLALFFGAWLGWLPSVGWGGEGLGGSAWTFRVLPALTVALFYGAYVARLIRAGLVDSLKLEFIRTARAKGVSPRRILWRHAMPVSVLPVVNFLGPALGGVLTGSFVIERIFFIPGLGTFFVQSALSRDYPLLLGLVVFYGLLIVILNALVDVILALLNPRVRSSMTGGRA